MKLHVAQDGHPWTIWGRGTDRVAILPGRNAGRKETRLRAAGFAWWCAGGGDDTGNIELPGDGWVANAADAARVECFVRGGDPTGLIRLAMGD